MNRARSSRYGDPSGSATLDDRNREADAFGQRWSKGHRGGKLILRDRTRPGDLPGRLAVQGPANARRPPIVDQTLWSATLAGADRACRRHEGAPCPRGSVGSERQATRGAGGNAGPLFLSIRKRPEARTARSPRSSAMPACHRQTCAYLRGHDDVRAQHFRLPAPRLTGPASAGPSPVHRRTTIRCAYSA